MRLPSLFISFFNQCRYFNLQKIGSKSKDINKEGKRILQNHDIFTKIDINTSSNSFITLKDHKENFANNPTVRLLNPAKNEIGRISKLFFQI